MAARRAIGSWRVLDEVGNCLFDCRLAVEATQFEASSKRYCIYLDTTIPSPGSRETAAAAQHRYVIGWGRFSAQLGLCDAARIAATPCVGAIVFRAQVADGRGIMIICRPTGC